MAIPALHLALELRKFCLYLMLIFSLSKNSAFKRLYSWRLGCRRAKKKKSTKAPWPTETYIYLERHIKKVIWKKIHRNLRRYHFLQRKRKKLLKLLFGLIYRTGQNYSVFLRYWATVFQWQIFFFMVLRMCCTATKQL